MKINETFTDTSGFQSTSKLLKDLKLDRSLLKTFNTNAIYKTYRDKRSWMDDQNRWHVYPLFVTNNHPSKGNIAVIICPICGQLHSHPYNLSQPTVCDMGCSELLINNLENISANYVLEPFEDMYDLNDNTNEKESLIHREF